MHEDAVIADPKGEVTRVNLAVKPDTDQQYYTVEKQRDVPAHH